MIPKNFIAGKNRKLKIEKREKITKPTKIEKLEDLIIDEIELNCTMKEVKENFDYDSLFLEELGINSNSIKRKILVKYYKEYKNKELWCIDVLLIEYGSKPELEENLPQIYGRAELYDIKDGVYKRFLFKDNIAIFVTDALSQNKVIPHYRSLGFKQLKRTFQAV